MKLKNGDIVIFDNCGMSKDDWEFSSETFDEIMEHDGQKATVFQGHRSHPAPQVNRS